ncbi:S8 family peptidase [Tabrizicola sp.]|uniref:S8 family peptidase n=1 Tax=Tabrizicola sp. TaxID=2005166 RepID=UPI0027371826|nr:S8 family peptidase [Tabrizicola sp.]MDP3196365.1 S8 family peptidase [Tabrizicola sp.]
MRRTSLLLSLSSFALLAACGGGEEAGFNPFDYLSPFAPPAPVSISVLTRGLDFSASIIADTAVLLATTRYRNTNVTIAWLQQNFDADIPDVATQDPIRTSGAAFAHAAGLSGARQYIAVSDEHISGSHETISGRVLLLSNGDPSDSQGIPNEHGTAVASVAAGNSSSFVGIAPEATILFGTWGDQDLANLGLYARANGAVAWNNSWGYLGLGADQAGFDAAFNNGAPQSAAYLASLDEYASEGVVVFSVSNDNLRDATLMDALPYLRPSLEAGWIATANGVPTFTGGSITDVHLLSNSCWQAARWCLVADGTWFAATGGGADYAPTTGSSFAAPQVSGALALLAQAFPTLSPHDLRVRLLASAADDFFSADDTIELADGFSKGYSVIYGHGFLDIEAALRPIGGTVMALSEGRTVSTDAPVLRTGSAFGNALETGLSGTDVAVQDALSAGFSMSADALTAGAFPGPQAAKLLARSLRGNLSAERLATPSALSDPFAAFTGPVLAMTANDRGTAAAVLFPEGSKGSAGVTVSQALTDGPVRVDLGVKVARDDGQLTSLDRDNAALMASVTLGVTQHLGNNAFVAMSGEVGVTDLGGATAFGDTGSARFDAVKLTVGRSDFLAKGDRISLGIGLPVAIASGQTVLDLPVVREGASAFDRVALDLAPDERQIDLDLTYQAELGDGLEFKLSLIQSENFGNRTGEQDTSGALAFAFRF